MAATKKIVVLPGDHIGPEITNSAVEVLKVVEKRRPELKLEFEEHKIGGASIDAFGTPLTDETIKACLEADGVLLGSVGGPEWTDPNCRPEQGLLKLRKSMNVWANLRPCNFASESLVKCSPLREEVAKGVDFCVVRELTGGCYFGDRKEDTGDGKACDTWPYSVEEVTRIARLAAWLAKRSNPPAPVTMLDKANVLASSRLWRKTCTKVFKEEFPELTLNFQLIDSAAMLVVKSPRTLNGVVLTDNLFGDIISDECSCIPGSLGLLPSASLSGVPQETSEKVHCLVEPIHGSAPDIAGKGIVNPIGTILSASLLLRWALNAPAEAQAIDDAVRKVLDDKSIGGRGLYTRDLGGEAMTADITKAVCEELEKLL
ncbi:3-isopropylmalate dehydrogenase Leu1 [Schizosaccharomyces japonicus yFS275]|uniref:3-isopropylmalate dehydrogenase n=1 Tax=Schizosaccharomyces japonicus (strain yFS275 / FY16936) TaxID=402676 RepID=B6K4K0_SCHJY|nr:3-isopropylmalate dehydrogenase Leu1 [Schizosaccharomyces japonicus yFS275]EEB08407.1 3-isopropylmalate dehydrogenase Leu1 [Schizosaccharomyces japonicus yFS275]